MKNGIRIITAMNRKGGCGKSTLIRGLASAAAARGESVTIFDTDGSRGLEKWMQRSEAAGYWNNNVNVIATLDAKRVDSVVKEIYEQPDQEHLILIDTFGGGSDPEAQDMLADISHLILAPMMLSEEDLAETVETALWYARLRKRVDDPSSLPPFHVVASRVPATLSAADKDVLMQAMSKLPIIDDFVQNRNAYQRMGNGLLGELWDRLPNRGVAEHAKDALTEMDDLLVRFDELIRGDE